MNTPVDNQRLMKTLDDAWNSQDWDTFNSRHAEKRSRVLAGAARTHNRPARPQSGIHRIFQDISGQSL